MNFQKPRKADVLYAIYVFRWEQIITPSGFFRHHFGTGFRPHPPECYPVANLFERFGGCNPLQRLRRMKAEVSGIGNHPIQVPNNCRVASPFSSADLYCGWGLVQTGREQMDPGTILKHVACCVQFLRSNFAWSSVASSVDEAWTATDAHALCARLGCDALRQNKIRRWGPICRLPNTKKQQLDTFRDAQKLV